MWTAVFFGLSSWPSEEQQASLEASYVTPILLRHIRYHPIKFKFFQEQKYITQAVRNVLKLSRQIYVTESEKYCMRRPPMLTLSSVISDITQFFLISGEMFLLLNHFVPLILCHIRYHPTKFNFSLSKNRNI